MKKIILTTCILLTSLAASAQHAAGSFTIQPKVGLNIATITKDDDADSRVGLAVGAEVEYQATDMVSVSGGLLYSMQGAKGNLGSIDGTMKLDYINIPILANVYVAKGFAVKLGLQPGFMVNDKIKVSQGGVSAEVGINEALKQAGIDETINKVDLAIPVGVSYEFSNFVVDARYNWGVTEIVKDANSKNSVFQFTVGYKFAL
jgi:opacity protein-like surface antigen